MNSLYHITLPTWPQALHSFRSGIEVLEIPYALAFIDALLAQHDAHPGRFHDAAQGLEAVGGLAYLEDLDEECIEGLVVNMPDNWTLLMRPWRDIWEVSVCSGCKMGPSSKAEQVVLGLVVAARVVGALSVNQNPKS